MNARFSPGPDFDAAVAEASRLDLLDRAETICEIAARTVHKDTAGYATYSLSSGEDARGVYAETNDYAGHIIEWGSEDQAPQAPIRTGAAAVGRFEPT